VSRALVPVAPADPAPITSFAASRPHAGFIAHLAATRAQAPQTRARRRAAPAEAIAAYGARPFSQVGGRVLRSL
jgi:hypothetical protein